MRSSLSILNISLIGVLVVAAIAVQAQSGEFIEATTGVFVP
ncbi:hypothetical protein [Cognatishimia sp. F0-27]|nr:hypothetical protein [Cognatishimia sp. F0-27]